MLSQLALLQADGMNTGLVGMLVGLALITLIVLGLRFLRNMFEVITAPTASLKYHGTNDHFFFSLMLVFLGGLIGTIILVAREPAIVAAWNDYSGTVAADLAAGNPNAIYRDVVRNDAQTTLNNGFDTFFLQNLIMVPMVFIGLWLLVGTLAFLLAKLFGGQATWVDLHGAIAYGGFFWAIGVCLFMVAGFGIVSSRVMGPGPQIDVAAIAGAILMAYGLILFLIGMAQAGDLTVGQTIGVVIGLAILFGGAAYGINHKGAEVFDGFRSRIQTFDPSRQQI